CGGGTRAAACRRTRRSWRRAGRRPARRRRRARRRTARPCRRRSRRRSGAGCRSPGRSSRSSRRGSPGWRTRGARRRARPAAASRAAAIVAAPGPAWAACRARPDRRGPSPRSCPRPDFPSPSSATLPPSCADRTSAGARYRRPVRRTLFTDEHELFRESVRRFIENEVVPHNDRWERQGIVDRSLFTGAGAHGFLGMAVPTEYGGGGVDDFRYNLVIAEEIQRAKVNAAGLGWTLHNDICLPYFLSLCTEEQKARWLPGIASGELITAIAMTEPGIGSDLASMATTAVRDGDHYVVNGSKTFITNGINADLVITAVKTDPSQRHRGISLLVLERGMPGFERGRNLEK